MDSRHHLLKSVQDAAPVLLHGPATSKRCSAASSWRCSSARSSNVRSGWAWRTPNSSRSGSTPSSATAPRLEIFATLSRHQLHHDGALIKTFHPELTTQQEQVLELMNLTPDIYKQLT